MAGGLGGRFSQGFWPMQAKLSWEGWQQSLKRQICVSVFPKTYGWLQSSRLHGMNIQFLSILPNDYNQKSYFEIKGKESLFLVLSCKQEYIDQ